MVEKKSGKATESIRVVIRCRPMGQKELEEGRECAVKMVKQKGEIFVQKQGEELPKVFTFDSVYDWNSEQANIFAETAYPVCENVIQGYNGTIFAYGQTGTGKTFTITGILKDEDQKGILPRAFENIFQQIKGDSKKQYLVRASYLEIYNEEIQDLLNKKGGGQRLELKDKDTGVYVKDLSTFVVKNPEDMMQIFQEGNLNRHVGKTNMNEHSSRSHSVFTVTVESSEVNEKGEVKVKAGKLNIVDLAGSERQSKTGATGDRLKEATKINLSLSTLCHVISSLTDPKCTYIPYRDSRLTRILQDSLGGNTKTVMIAAIGPADYNVDETMSTLRYASRAKHIQNKPRINEDPKDAMIREFHDEITRLREQLAKLSGGKMGNATEVGPDGQPQAVTVEKFVAVEDRQRMQQMEEQLEKEKKQIMKKFEKERAMIDAKVEIADEEKQKLIAELDAKQQDAQKEKQNQQKLLKKIKNMEDKLLHGTEAMEKAMKQEQKLLKTKAEIEERRRQQLIMEQELSEKQEMKLNIKQEFGSIQEEIANIDEETNRVAGRLQHTKGEIEDFTEMIHQEREDLMDRIRELTREIRLKHLIIDQFIPALEYMKLERRAEWSDEINEWMIPNLEYSGNNIKVQKAQSKEGKVQKQWKQLMDQNIMGLSDSEDEDYEAAATKRVNEAISSILLEEEAEMGEQQPPYIPPEKQSVFFRYTDDGAVREDPEEAAKKEKNRKKRLQSAKRPLTAKKKKADMVTGDLVSMVQTMGAQQNAEQKMRIKREKMYPKALGLVTK